MKKANRCIELGSLLEEARKYCKDDSRVESFLAELMEFEKIDPYAYKSEIKEMLRRHVDSEDHV